MNSNKRHITKGTVLIIAFIMVLSILFAGCTRDEETKTEPTKQPTQEQEEEVTPTPEPESLFDENGAYKETVTLTTIGGLGQTSLFEEYKFEDESYENNRYVQLIREKLNVEIEYVAIVESSQKAERRKIMIASGDIPDFFGSDTVEVAQLYQADLIQPVGDIFDEYASDTVKEFHNLVGDPLWSSTTYGGERMALPIPGLGDPVEGSTMMWIRLDWLDNLELDVPETVEDLIALVRAFKNDDPNKSGSDDTLGLGMMPVAKTNPAMKGFFNSFGAYPYNWLLDEETDTIYSGYFDPEVKAALLVLSELYKEGVIDLEFTVKDGNQFTEDIVSGKVGLLLNGMAVPLLHQFNSLKELDPDSNFLTFKLPNKPSIDAEKPPVTVISKDCENPEAVILIYNLAAYVAYDSTTEDYEIYAANETAEIGIELSPISRPLLAGKNSISAVLLDKALKSGQDVMEYYDNYDGIKTPRNEYETLWSFIDAYINEGDINNYMWYCIFGSDGSQMVIDYYRQEKYYIEDMHKGPPTETMVTQGETLDKMSDEIFTRIIMGEDDISAYDKFLEDWKNLGGDSITQELNDWYQLSKTE